MSVRIEKINNEIRKQLMKVIQEEVDDPKLGLLTITKVDTTPDLKEARVYYSLLDQKKQDRAKKLLEEMGGFIKNNLAKKIRLKKMPELLFFSDDSIKYSVDIYQKIEELKDAKDKKK